MGIVLVVSCPGGELSIWGVVLEGNCPGGGVIRVGVPSCPGRSCHRTKF